MEGSFSSPPPALPHPGGDHYSFPLQPFVYLPAGQTMLTAYLPLSWLRCSRGCTFIHFSLAWDWPTLPWAYKLLDEENKATDAFAFRSKTFCSILISSCLLSSFPSSPLSLPPPPSSPSSYYCTADYNAVLVSAIQQSGLVVRIHLFILFHILFPSPSPCESLSRVQLFATLWTIACQAPLPIG